MSLRDSNIIIQSAVTLILNASPDAVLLNDRARILNEAGYYTSSARTLEQALQHAVSMNCAMALICHRFAPDERKELTQRLRKLSPGTAIICLDREVDKNQVVLLSRIERALARLTA